jgi:predicted ATPase
MPLSDDEVIDRSRHERRGARQRNKRDREIALLSPKPEAAKAEDYFQRALLVARQQQAKSWELRAAMSLSRLWRDQGKPQQARDLLAPVYGWFTEGFDTRDLKEAKALVDDLAQQTGSAANVAWWHLTDVPSARLNVRCGGEVDVGCTRVIGAPGE